MHTVRLVTALFVFAGAAAAQPAPEVKDGKVTIPLTLTPTAASSPLSKSYLLPEYGELQPGEQLSGFLKCFMEQDVFYNQANQEKRLKWLALPLADLPTDVRQQAGIHSGMAYQPKYASMMVFADQAARYTRAEWNEYFNLRHDGVYMLLPEVQKLRTLAYVIQLRTRGEVKAGEFDKALVSTRTQFGLAKFLATNPTLISGLVGIAIAHQGVTALEEMIGRPGCPNLYWSFADLPTPFISMRLGTSGERFFVNAQFGHDIRTDRAMTDQEIADVVRVISELRGISGNVPEPLDRPGILYATLATSDERLNAIRDRLTKSGQSADVVKTFPKLQLVLLEDLYRYESTRDEILKWMNRPHHEALAGLERTEEMVKAERKAGWVLGPIFLPSSIKVKQAQARLDQRFALLMTIEAIRLFAHENGGKLPGKLSDIKVTVPNDPVTNTPFGYSVKDGLATLQPAKAILTTDNRVYELRIAK